MHPVVAEKSSVKDHLDHHFHLKIGVLLGSLIGSFCARWPGRLLIVVTRLPVFSVIDVTRVLLCDSSSSSCRISIAAT